MCDTCITVARWTTHSWDGERVRIYTRPAGLNSGVCGGRLERGKIRIVTTAANGIMQIVPATPRKFQCWITCGSGKRAASG